MQARRRAKAQKADGPNLDELIASGESGAYEALQLYRSRALRARGKNDSMLAMSTAAGGSIKLINAGYFAAATELCNQLLDFLNEFELDIATPEIREMVFSVDDALISAVEGNDFEENKKENMGAVKVRKDFLKGAVKWTQTCGRCEHGDPALHVRLGAAMWTTDDKGSVYHYVAGEAPQILAHKISDTFLTMERVTERDRALVSSVCHFLALENLRDANELLTHFRKAQKNRGNSVDTKLVLFCTQLLECCRRDATALYKKLVLSVAAELKAWNANPVSTLLDGPIGSKFFGIEPKVHPMMQMMQQFLS